jgi:secreted PhoX family phosphatase
LSRTGLAADDDEKEDRMTKLPDDKTLARRSFLKGFGGASTLAAVAVTAPLAVATDANAQESRDERRKARYRETDHVKAFYRTNRY